jgi:outer membrane immunogenic protein
MKPVLLASALLGSLLTGSAAQAADMPIRVPEPQPVAARNWTGCYLGAGGGYGFYNQSRETIGDGSTALIGGNFNLALAANPGTVLVGNETFGGHGWLVTAQGGCDYQFGGNWVIGAFADGDWSDMSGDHGLLGIVRGEQTLSSSWAVGGRVGWLVTPTLLTFVSGGYTRANFDAVDYTNNFASSAIALTSPSASLAIATTGSPGLQLGAQSYDGFFIGGGAEYALGWWRNVFWKTEYRFADYRSATTTINCVNAALCGTSGPIGLSERIHPTVQTVRSELVWRFGR